MTNEIPDPRISPWKGTFSQPSRPHHFWKGVAAACLMLFLTPVAAVAETPYTDSEISTAIDDQMLQDPGVNSLHVDVTTDHGVATLTGSVDNLLAKERAADIAETVKGVRSVVNRIEVVPGEKSDRSIRRDIITAFLNDPVTESWEVQVHVDHGQATLSGSVDSWQEKQLAALVAKGVSGVTGLTNDLNVDYATDRSDEDIRAEIVKALRWNALVDDSLITVTVQDGKVTLTGTVGSAAEQTRAKSLAWVAGVRDVEENLQIKWWARDDRLRDQKYQDRTDEEIEQAIKDAFLYDPRVLSFDLHVDVSNGRATLTGVVDNLKAKRSAAQDARNTVGVWGVENQIKVRSEFAEDAKTAQRVRAALERDPYVERYEIDVSVIDGKAYLTGTVDTTFEKAQAENVTSVVNGVTGVHNSLAVTGNDWLSYDPYTYSWYPYDYDWYEYPDSTTMADWEIAQEIRQELFWSPFVDEDQVNVSVDNGIATLSGEVDSWNEHQFAAENAREGGAVAVINELEVDYGPSS